MKRWPAFMTTTRRQLNAFARMPPDHVTFVDLYIAGRHSPDLASQLWEKVQQAARTELQTGHRAACVVANPSLGSGSSCWPKARFLALRAELLEGWQPRNSVERLLVDTLVQAQTQYEHWLELLTARTTLQADLEGKDGRWSPPRVTDADAIDQAAVMVERFHRLIMRTARQLQNLRRVAPLVMVQNAGQVNVANQQVNGVAGG